MKVLLQQEDSPKDVSTKKQSCKECEVKMDRRKRRSRQVHYYSWDVNPSPSVIDGTVKQKIGNDMGERSIIN